MRQIAATMYHTVGRTCKLGGGDGHLGQPLFQCVQMRRRPARANAFRPRLRDLGQTCVKHRKF